MMKKEKMELHESKEENYRKVLSDEGVVLQKIRVMVP